VPNVDCAKTLLTVMATIMAAPIMQSTLRPVAAPRFEGVGNLRKLSLSNVKTVTLNTPLPWIWV
jgi:hypothetical protein